MLSIFNLTGLSLALARLSCEGLCSVQTATPWPAHPGSERARLHPALGWGWAQAPGRLCFLPRVSAGISSITFPASSPQNPTPPSVFGLAPLPPQLQATYPPCSCCHLPDCTVSEQTLEQNHVRCLSHLDGSAAPWCPGHGWIRPSRPPLFPCFLLLLLPNLRAPSRAHHHTGSPN